MTLVLWGPASILARTRYLSRASPECATVTLAQAKQQLDD